MAPGALLDRRVVVFGDIIDVTGDAVRRASRIVIEAHIAPTACVMAVRALQVIVVAGGGTAVAADAIGGIGNIMVERDT